MKDYASMSDYEIAEKIGKAIGLVSVAGDLYIKNGVWARFDPCNNPADAWPVILQSKISIFALDDDDWGARGYNCIIRSINPNPLRAAMELFLKMKESEND